MEYNDTLGWYYTFSALGKYHFRIEGNKQRNDFHIPSKRKCARTKAVVKVTKFWRDSSGTDTPGDYLVSYEILNIGSFRTIRCSDG